MGQTFNHNKIIHQFLKAIELCPMDDVLKMILRFKIWGVHPEVFHPLTIQQTAKIAKINVKKAEELEDEAKYYLYSYLKDHPIVDIEGNFTASNKKKLLDAYGTPLKV